MTHVYVAGRSSGLTFSVVYKNEDGEEIRYPVKFNDGQFKTDDDLIANAIDDLISKNMNIRSRCKKADKAAAEELALQHKALLQKTGAHKGGVSSIAMKNAMSTEMQQRDAELNAAGADKEEIAAGESLILTEQGETLPSPDLPKANAITGADKEKKPVFAFAKK